MFRIACTVLALLCFSLPALGQSLNMTQLGNLPYAQDLNDVWGYESGGVELALVGTMTGLSVVNATNPAAPVEVAFFPGTNSIWRDIKTYQNYAYCSNDDGGGMLIVDLTNPLVPVKVTDLTTYFSAAHNLYVDEAAARLYVAGPDNGGIMVLDLTTPASPTLIGNFNSYYVHDMYARAGIVYAAPIFEGYLSILDMTSLPTITELGTIPTQGLFTHNTWLSDSGDYCLTTDEISGGGVGVFDVTNLASPVEIAFYPHPDDPAVIVHNAHYLGDLGYISWYRSGIEVMDLSDPYFPGRAGYYDTYLGSGSGFQGAWGAYPFQPSGNIYVSDIDTGLHILNFSANHGWIEGFVTDANTTNPIAGASCTVLSTSESVASLADGRYRFTEQPGSYQVAFSAYGYIPDTISVVVTADNTANGDIALQPEPNGSIDGSVLLYPGLSPVSGIEVVLEGTPQSDITDGSGLFALAAVPVGPYTISTSPFGYAPAEATVVVVDGQTTTETLYLIESVVIDDLENTSGWTIGAAGDAATTGIWELADPVGTNGGTVQPEDDHTAAPGVLCYVTGASGAGLGTDDVDGGATTLISPVMDLSGVTNPTLRLHRWYSNNAGSNPSSDTFSIDLSEDGGTGWVNLETLTQTRNFWEVLSFDLSTYATSFDQIRLRFVARDLGGGSIVEAAIDDIDVYGETTILGAPGRPIPVLPVRLHAPNPNPLRSSTSLRFELPEAGRATLQVFDVRGRVVADLVDGELAAGAHSVSWDGKTRIGNRASAGLYFVRLAAAGGIQTQKLTVWR